MTIAALQRLLLEEPPDVPHHPAPLISHTARKRQTMQQPDSVPGPQTAQHESRITNHEPTAAAPTSPARAAAETLAAQGKHVHYVTEGQSLCLSGQCATVVGP